MRANIITHCIVQQAAAQFEQQTSAARVRYCNWLISEALEPVLTFLKVCVYQCSVVGIGA